MFLKIENLRKTYDRTEALKGISFSVPEGSIFGLLGPNGAGKTTFIRILNRIIAYDSGTILFKDKPLGDEHISQIGYLPEERGLYKKMTVGEQIMYFAQLKGMSKDQAYQRARSLLLKFEMLSWWNKKVQELSKGMQQKVQFVITIIHDPELLIFDEPFSGFDPINQQLLKSEILELNKKGKTILFSTHNMASVEEICDSIVLINQGEILLEGEINKIKDRYKQDIYLLAYAGGQDLFRENETFKVVSFDKGAYKIKITGQADSNQLLAYASQFGKIVRFEELLPSLNDIFISVVQSSKNKES